MDIQKIISLINEGKFSEAFDAAPESLRNSMLSFVNDPKSFKDHYTKDNDRIPGAQISLNWGIDGRQQQAINQIKELHATHLLDIGCADGSFDFLCLRQNAVIQATGVDIWENGIKWANEYGKDKNASFICGMFEQVEVPQTYDVVHIGEVLEHVINPVTILNKIKYSGLKGVVITVPIKSPPMDKNEEMRILSGGALEHVRHINERMLNFYARECGYYINDMKREGVNWVTLITTLIPERD